MQEVTRILFVSSNPPKPFYYSRGESCNNMLLQHSQEQNGKEAKWTKEREMRWKFSSITLSQDMVRNEWVRGSIYTWEGKATPLGWVTSVTHQRKDTFRVLVS